MCVCICVLIGYMVHKMNKYYFGRDYIGDRFIFQDFVPSRLRIIIAWVPSHENCMHFGKRECRQICKCSIVAEYVSTFTSVMVGCKIESKECIFKRSGRNSAAMKPEPESTKTYKPKREFVQFSVYKNPSRPDSELVTH